MICERSYAEPMRVGADREFLTLVQEPAAARRTPTRKPTRRKNATMRRIEVGFLAIATLAAFTALTSCAVSWWHTTGQAAAPSASYATITVAKGDTLWSIARQNTAASQLVPDKLEQIRAINPSLQLGRSLTPGQTLLVPTNGPVMPDQLHLAQANVAHRAF